MTTDKRIVVTAMPKGTRGQIVPNVTHVVCAYRGHHLDYRIECGSESVMRIECDVLEKRGYRRLEWPTTLR
jgi:hypothetical protein